MYVDNCAAKPYYDIRFPNIAGMFIIITVQPATHS